MELILSLLTQGGPYQELLDDWPELEHEDILVCIAYEHAAIAGDSRRRCLGGIGGDLLVGCGAVGEAEQ